nr:MAG TPA: hypothetical protein [Caudoviricetes sp.]
MVGSFQNQFYCIRYGCRSQSFKNAVLRGLGVAVCPKTIPVCFPRRNGARYRRDRELHPV